jgi:penicillin amidase
VTPVRRRLASIAAAVLALAMGGIGVVLWLAWASLPQLDGERAIAGLEAPVTISRDALGIPLIEAASERDAAMALGFVHAQDRLWQMEMSRRIGAGRLAEVLGEPGLPADRFMRTLGLYRAAEAALGHLSPTAIERLEAYALGVNAVIEDRSRPLPPEFLLLRHRPEPWRPADSLVLIKTMALSLVEGWRRELTRASVAGVVPPASLDDLWPPARPDTVTTIAGYDAVEPSARDQASLRPPALGEPSAVPAIAGLARSLLRELPDGAESGLGSNIWAVAGRHTATGAGLLANDPHLGTGTPAHWYLVAIRTPAGSVQGATLPALPVVVIGRNAHIAWGFTNTAADTEDLFIERLDPDDPDRYLTPEGSEPFATREEVIAVNGGEPVTVEVRETRHGPVLSDILPAAAGAAGDGHVLALAWTALLPEDRTIEAGVALARATDWASFNAAIDHFTAPTQNAFYADRHGRIGVRLAGRLPDRRRANGDLPAPGWTGAHDWAGLLPTAVAPRSIDPLPGFLLNANNRLVGPAFPYHLTDHWNDDLRARRIEAVLAASTDGGGQLDVEAMRRLQADRLSMLARDFLPLLEAVPPADRREAEILAGLAAWDGSSRADRPEPLIFQAWYRALVEHVLADDLGAAFADYRGIRSDAMRHIIESAPAWCDDRGSAGVVESCADMADAALATALDRLDRRYGGRWRQWRWGAASRVHMAHQPLDAVWGLRRLFSLAAEGGGDAGTVDVARYAAAAPYTTVAAASLRLVADLAEPATLHAILPSGQSGHPLSRHFADQKEMWRHGRLHPMHIADGAREERHILRLSPAAAGELDTP